MDTIFVKNVRENSPAYEAGLATGDRIISVNGQTITGHTYAQVVQLIQQSGSFLHLLVVPKEDDILQLYFGETAHNPETNQRPSRVKSPEISEWRYTAESMFQHHKSSHQGLPHHRRHSASQQRSLQPPTETSSEVWNSPLPPEGFVIGSKNRGTSVYVPASNSSWHRSRNQAGTGRRSSEGPILTRREAVYGYIPGSPSDVYPAGSVHHYNTSVSDHRLSSDHTGSVFKPLQFFDDQKFSSNDVSVTIGSASSYPLAKLDSNRSLIPLQRQQLVTAQLPSSDSMASSQYGSSENVHSSSSSLQGLCYSGPAGCRLSLDGGRRESSVSLPCSSLNDNFASDGSKDSLLSCDSTSTLTGGQDCCSSDDSVIISRIRKSFEQKEEFLRRPNQPISWNPPENENSNRHLENLSPSPAIIAREFYARPQKFQHPVWPPQSPSASPSPHSYRQQSPSRTLCSGKTNHSNAINSKPANQSLRRVKSDVDSGRDSISVRNAEGRLAVFERAASEPCEDYGRSRGQFVCGGAVTNVPPPVVNKTVCNQTLDNAALQFRPIMPAPGATSGVNHRHGSGKTAFVTTLSRIHENIPASDSVNGYSNLNYLSSKASDASSASHKNGETSSLPPSLNSSPVTDLQQFSRSLSSPTEESTTTPSRYPQHPMLQLVSRRARQFETGILDDDSPSDRTSLYKSELSRLSAKKSVPNVAVRKREFESRAGSSNCDATRESRRPNRESRSLESAVTQPSGNVPAVSGNQMIPIGGRNLHCEPPHDFQQLSTITELPPSALDDSSSGPVKLRARSNSAESWPTAASINRTRNVLEWPPGRVQDPEPQRHKAVRQDSYLAAVRTPVVSTDHSSRLLRQSAVSLDEEDDSAITADIPAVAPPVLMVKTPTPPHPAVRPTELPIPFPLRPAEHTDDESPSSIGRDAVVPEDKLTVPVHEALSDQTLSTVVRRQKIQQPLAEEERLGRRVSYLKATWGDRMHVDSDLDLSDGESQHMPHHRSIKKWRPPLFPEDIQRLKRIFEDVATSVPSHHPPRRGSSFAALDQPIKLSGKENLVVVREGNLHCKVTLIDGKRASDRSWKVVWAVLRGPVLTLHKERRDVNHSAQTPIGNEGDQQIDMRSSQIEIPEDYTKRKHVLRVNTSTGSEVLLQAEDADDMNQWLLNLNSHSQLPEENGGVDAKRQSFLQQLSPNARLSPLPTHKGLKKLTALRNRSPTGQAAITKARKQSQSDQLPSPKHKTWKGRVARQFKRIQHVGSSPNSPTAPLAENITFGIPLEECTPSSFCMYVPLLVELCTTVVDTKGLDVVGIYRVPGNTAAVTALTELLSKGFDEIALQDNRWQDVNVISSLLKLFFRKLPDALLTSELYDHFIEADKIEEPNKRMAAIKKLVHSLPDWHFETLKYLMFHLKRVVQHSERNKMEAKNLAIVFGPTLVRSADCDMITMVTDMSHQCRIVESLITNVEWFYADDDDDPPESTYPAVSVQEQPEVEPTSTNQNLLLNNISKVQGIKAASPTRDINAKVLVSSIISAANRKIQKSKSRKGTGSTSTAEEADCGDGAEEKKIVFDMKMKNPAECASGTDDTTPPSHSSAVASSIIESVILSGDIVKHLQANDDHCEKEEGIDVCNNQPKKWSNESHSKTNYEDGTIRTYAGLSATTQERIRRFELETKAMLQRDQTRHRHEQLEADKLRIELQWQEAKKDLEVEDTLDKMADNISDIRRTRGKATDEDVLHLQHLSLMDRGSLVEETSDRSSSQCPVITRIKMMQPSGYMMDDHVSGTALSPQLPRLHHDPSKYTSNDKNEFKDLHFASPKSFMKTSAEHLKMGMLPSDAVDGSTDIQKTHYPGSGYEQIEELDQSCPHDPADVTGGKEEENSKNRQWDSGSDLLASLTSTFDRKLKSLLYTSSSPLSTTDAVLKPTANKSQSAETPNEEDVQVREVGTVKSQVPTTTFVVSTTSTLFRDPSLHRGRSFLLERQNKLKLSMESDDKREMELTSEALQDDVRSDSTDNENEACIEGKEPVGEKLKLADLHSRTPIFEPVLNSTMQKISESTAKLEKELTHSNSKLKRSESLNKPEKLSGTSTKLRRSESLTKAERADSSSNTKLKRSDSLTKTEKTESNNSKRKQDLLLNSSFRSNNRGCNKEKENMASNLTKLKRKNGMPERSIKRRHTVGGTKDFDKLNWLDNRLRQQHQDEIEAVLIMSKERHCLRTSSPDLSSSRFGNSVGRERFLVEIRTLRSGGLMAELRPHITSSGRPRSLPDPNLASRVFKVPLESHV